MSTGCPQGLGKRSATFFVDGSEGRYTCGCTAAYEPFPGGSCISPKLKHANRKQIFRLAFHQRNNRFSGTPLESLRYHGHIVPEAVKCLCPGALPCNHQRHYFSLRSRISDHSCKILSYAVHAAGTTIPSVPSQGRSGLCCRTL